MIVVCAYFYPDGSRCTSSRDEHAGSLGHEWVEEFEFEEETPPPIEDGWEEEGT